MESSQNSPLSGLATKILDLTRELDHLILTNNLPKRSLDVNGPSEYPAKLSNGSELSRVRYEIVDVARNLINLALGPKEALFQLSFSHHNCASLAGIAHYSLANAVPINGAISYAEIGSVKSLTEFQVRSLVRHAITNGIFDEPKPGYVSHNALSKLLLEPPIAAIIGHNAHEVFPAAGKISESWDTFPGSGDPSETAFSISMGKRIGLFEYMEQNRDSMDRFRLAMTGLTSGGAHDKQHLVKGYKWGKLADGSTVVDVGGSEGYVGIALVEEYPSLNVIIQDLPGVVTQGEKHLLDHLRSKVHFEAHDFFLPQTQEADVYLLRHILHDWSDKYCITILQHIAAKMKPNSCIIINDAVMGEMMITLFNAKERTLTDWKTLFAQADSRLILKSVHTPDGSEMAIMEVGLRK
ncbi:S-adenosyl-L-methionine-dependent methyltransferase [Xylogone sp. PMI_703]|nr:S-adenosyl-L-methionine-dependent methyltransferase [Xylogone sp. PMI_703]